MAENSQLTTAQGVPQAPGGQLLKPHRGSAVLVLGILGLVVCVICGIIAWVMGNNDLREMAAGTMDASGRGLTQAGKICGMISVLLMLVVPLFILLMLLFFGIMSAGHVTLSR
jgi:hypothetical protein